MKVFNKTKTFIIEVLFRGRKFADKQTEWPKKIQKIIFEEKINFYVPKKQNLNSEDNRKILFLIN